MAVRGFGAAVMEGFLSGDGGSVVRNHRFGWLGFGGLILAAPQAAFAHPGGHAAGDAASSLWLGVLHPLTGLDHLCTMVLVGFLAGQLGGRALYLLPAAFVAMMVAGGALGASGVPLSLAEAGIALSMIVLGAVVALGIRLPTTLAAAVIGLFAVFHGQAHGAEMPETAVGLAFGLGFTLATLGLLSAGIGFSFAVSRISGSWQTAAIRTTSGALVCAGAVLLYGGFAA
jgi:urease accessory protein